MTAIPPPTRYHRWLGWHAPALRRTVIVGATGLIVAAALLWFLPWGVAVVTGWDVAALAFLVSVWPVIIRADGPRAAQLAKREDENRGSATALLLAASVASLLGVGFALTLAGRESGALQVLLIGFAVLTVVLSWTVVNTVFTLRYADLHFGSRDAGIAFDESDEPERTQLPRLRLRCLHHRHVLPGIRHHDPRSTDPAYRALPCPAFVPVRRRYRGRLGQPHRRPDSLDRSTGLSHWVDGFGEFQDLVGDAQQQLVHSIAAAGIYSCRVTRSLAWIWIPLGGDDIRGRLSARLQSQSERINSTPP